MEQRKLHLILHNLMKNGNSQKALRILQKSLSLLQLSTSLDGFSLLNKAIEHSNPYIKLRSVKRRGLTFLKALPLTPLEQEHLAIKWLIDGARTSKGRDLSSKLAKQITLVAAKSDDAEVLKRIKDLHRAAEAHR